MVDFLLIVKYVGGLITLMTFYTLINKANEQRIRRINQEELSALDKKERKEREKILKQIVIEREESLEREALERKRLEKEFRVKEEIASKDREVMKQQLSQQHVLNERIIIKLENIEGTQQKYLENQEKLFTVQEEICGQQADLETVNTNQNKEIKDSKEQREILISALYAILISFEREGFNGPITTNKKQIESYFKERVFREES